MQRPKYTATVTNNQGKVILKQTFDFYRDALEFCGDLMYNQSIAMRDVKRIVIERSKK